MPPARDGVKGASPTSGVAAAPDALCAFSSLLKDASTEELAAYRLAIESAQASRTASPLAAGMPSAEHSTMATLAELPAEGAEVHGKGVDAAASTAPDLYFEAALDVELAAHGPHWYDLMVLGAPSLRCTPSDEAACAAVEAVVNRLHNILLLCLAAKTSALIVFSPNIEE